jgi:hypothetical protein
MSYTATQLVSHHRYGDWRRRSFGPACLLHRWLGYSYWHESTSNDLVWLESVAHRLFAIDAGGWGGRRWTYLDDNAPQHGPCWYRSITQRADITPMQTVASDMALRFQVYNYVPKS